MSEKAYIGILPCGCAPFAMVAGFEPKRAEERELAKLLREGYRIEIMAPEKARELPNFLKRCPHAPPPPEDAKAAAEQLVLEVRGEA